jgi:hypothetical protein
VTAPLATFVLYAYNEEKYIREAIQSAFAQTYSPLEIVLSDDGSPDCTWAIIQEMAAAYRGPHEIILNHNATNIGIGSQLNAAWRKSRGELLVLANADDVSEPKRVERIVEAWLSQGKRAAAICSSLAVVGPDGVPTGRVMRFDPDFRDLALATRNRFGGPGAAGLAIRRDCFDRFGELMNGLILEDGPLNLRATLLGEWQVLDEPLVRYRVHSENISQAYHVEEFGPWRLRHRATVEWQRREGQKAFVQMLVDLHSATAEQTDPAHVRCAREEAAQRLKQDQLLTSYYSQDWVRPLRAWWKEWAGWTLQLAKVTVKATLPWIERRNDRWHYENVRRTNATSGSSRGRDDRPADTGFRETPFRSDGR